MELSFGSRDTQEKLSDLDRNGYYNKTIHTCILKLHIPKEIIDQIYGKNIIIDREQGNYFGYNGDDHPSRKGQDLMINLII